MKKTDPESRKRLAESYFMKGYNCSQSVVLTFDDILPVESDIALRIASPFGGGMGRLCAKI